jgi:hypothetical protein
LPGSDQALIVAHNDDDFAQATIHLLQNAEFRKKLEERAWDYAREHIDPGKALALLDRVYASL